MDPGMVKMGIGRPVADTRNSLFLVFVIYTLVTEIIRPDARVHHRTADGGLGRGAPSSSHNGQV